jgi:hypothetical protein
MAKKKKKTILIIGTIVILFLLVGGAFLIIRNSSETKNPSNKPFQEEKKDKPIPPKKDNPDNPQPDQPKNPPQSPQPNPDSSKNNKIEIKCFWVGNLWFNEKYDEFWTFCEGEEWSKAGKQRFLIAKNYSVLVGKSLSSDLSFTLVYDEKEVVKEVVQGSDDKPLLTIFKSGFSLTSDSPLKDDPNFRTDWEKGHSAKERVQFVGKANNDIGKETIFFNNYFADENGRRPDTLKTFHITTDSLLAKQLLTFSQNKNKLQKGKKFFLSFNKIASYDKILNLWYFDSSCDRKVWIDEV